MTHNSFDTIRESDTQTNEQKFESLLGKYSAITQKAEVTNYTLPGIDRTLQRRFFPALSSFVAYLQSTDEDSPTTARYQKNIEYLTGFEAIMATLERYFEDPLKTALRDELTGLMNKYVARGYTTTENGLWVGTFIDTQTS